MQHLRKVGVLLLSIGTASACSNEPAATNGPVPSAAMPPPDNAIQNAPAPALPAPDIALTAAQRADACRTTIAELNGREKRTMRVVADAGDTVRVRYTRPDDGTVWTNECKFERNRVIWRTVDAFGPGSGLGRWRDGPPDETITYSVSGNSVRVNITY